MRAATLALVVALVSLAGCSAGPTGSGPDRSIVALRAHVDLPARLPDGLTPDRVTVSVTDEPIPPRPAEIDPQHEAPARSLRVQLGPDGVEFDEPATLKVELPSRDLPTTLLAFHVHRGTIELLDVAVIIDGDRAVLSMPVRGFSDVRIEFYQLQSFVEGTIRVDVLPAHRVVLVGAEFDMNATLDRPELDREIAAYIELDSKPVWVTYRVRFTGGWSVDRGEFSAEAPVTPESVPNRPGARTEVRGLAYASEFAYFTCTAPGKTEIDYVVNAYRTAEATPAGAASDLGFPSRELELGIFYKTWKGGFTDSPRAHPATVECVTTLPSPSPTPTRTPTAAAGHVRSDVLVIGGEHYPREQFAVGEPDACNTRHWHASTRVYSIEGTKQTPPRGILDPAPGECGFGKVGEVPVQALDIPEADWRAYRTALGGG